MHCVGESNVFSVSMGLDTWTMQDLKNWRHVHEKLDFTRCVLMKIEDNIVAAVDHVFMFYFWLFFFGPSPLIPCLVQGSGAFFLGSYVTQVQQNM